MKRKIILIILIFLILYSAFNFPIILKYGLFYDDFSIANYYKSFENFTFKNSELFRPIPTLLFIAYNQLGDFNFYGHLFNLIFNFLTVLFASIIILKLSDSKIFVILFVLSYIFHVSTSYNLIWVSGIQTILGGFFMVLTIYFLINNNFTGLCISYILAILSYENNLMLLIIVPIIHIYLKKPRKDLSHIVISFSIISILYYVVRSSLNIHIIFNKFNFKRLLLKLGEYFFVIINGIDRPLLARIVDIQDNLFLSEWIYLIFIIILSISFYFIIFMISKDKLKSFVLVFGLLFLTGLPYLLGRRSFTPRLAYSQIFFIGLLLALNKKKMILSIIAVSILCVFSIYSYIRFLDIQKIVNINRNAYENLINRNYSIGEVNVIGISPSVYYGFPIIQLAKKNFNYIYDLDVYPTNLNLHMLGRKLKNFKKIVTCNQINSNSYRYTVQDHSSYIKERLNFNKYKIGQEINSKSARCIVRGINSRGYIIQFDIILDANSKLVDYNFWNKDVLIKRK